MVASIPSVCCKECVLKSYIQCATVLCCKSLGVNHIEQQLYERTAARDRHNSNKIDRTFRIAVRPFLDPEVLRCNFFSGGPYSFGSNLGAATPALLRRPLVSAAAKPERFHLSWNSCSACLPALSMGVSFLLYRWQLVQICLMSCKRKGFCVSMCLKTLQQRICYTKIITNNMPFGKRFVCATT